MIVAIGMDPGPTPGLVALTYADLQLVDIRVVQCSANAVMDILRMWLPDTALGRAEYYFGVERFVIGKASMRSGSPGARTRDMVGEAIQAAAGRAYVTQRTASQVKEWGTDLRLRRAGLYDATTGMQHARDGARHALYTAVAEGKIPDPLSRKARRKDG